MPLVKVKDKSPSEVIVDAWWHLWRTRVENGGVSPDVSEAITILQKAREEVYRETTGTRIA